jgi:hypothetical protein
VPALGGIAFAVLFFGTVLRRDELGKQRDDLGMAGRDRGRRQQGMVALHLAVGPFSPQAVRTNNFLRAEILGAVPADQDSVAKPRESLAERRRGEQLLHALETWLQQHWIGGIEHVTDVIVGGDFPDSEQGLAIRPPMAFLQGALECQKRGTLHEKQSERPFEGRRRGCRLRFAIFSATRKPPPVASMRSLRRRRPSKRVVAEQRDDEPERERGDCDVRG